MDNVSKKTIREEIEIFSKEKGEGSKSEDILPVNICPANPKVKSKALQTERTCSNFLEKNFVCLLTLFKMAKSPPPTSFSPVTSTNVGISPKNFLTFSFDPFATLVLNCKFLPSASPKLLNLKQDHPSKKAVFLIKFL